MPDEPGQHKHRWRFYHTASGNQPAKDFILQLPDDDRARIIAAMEDVRLRGLPAARHLQADIYEVRAIGKTQSVRILFATEGRFSQILLALEAFSKKTQKTPAQAIALAESRLADWRQRRTHA